MKIIYYFIISVFILAGAGCTGSKSYSNKAKKLQAAGMNDEAANFFLQALQRNPKNVDAKIGLNQTGQIQIEKTLTSFYKAYSVSNYKEAVYKYQEALNYKRQYGYFVSVEIPPYYDAYYKEMLVVYLADRYEVAGDLLYEEKFDDANLVYKEILELDPEYKDVQDLSLTSTIEPLYRKGVAEFDLERYRSCYGMMSRVLVQKPMYKDAIDYKERALEEGQITLAILAFESNVAAKKNIANAIHGDVVSGLIKSNDPFIKVIDRTNMDALIKEQKINVKNASTGNGAIQTGELLGANMLIKGKLLRYSSTGGSIHSYRKQGFESYRVKKVNPDTKKTYYETKYKRVNYTEFEGSASVFVEVQYQMISAETGEVVKSDVLRKSSSDYVNYISFSGNYKNLYAGKYSGKGSDFVKGDVIYNSFSQKNKIKQKAKTNKRSLKSEQQLASESLNVISLGIIRGVSVYNPDDK
tara:strand:+ start:49978 stop:51381 length:1404 start_codon:yes stop_codon:yes gene_type:complete